MTAATFDTLGYFEKLKGAGFTETQAKVQVEAMQGVVQSYDESSRKELATKGDILQLENKIENTKHELLKWMIATMVAQTALIVAVIAFLK